MRRGFKLAAAAIVALLLHTLLLKLVSVPAVPDGGADRTGDGPTALAPQTAAPEAVAATAPLTEPEPPQAMDVGWPEPEIETPEPQRARSRPRTALAVQTPPPPLPPAPVTPAATEQAITLAPDAGSAAEPVVAPAGSGYGRRVREHLARFAGNLPPGASGEARVQFVVQPDGQVSEVRLVKRSGHLGLDAVALSLPEIAQPLPSPGERAQRLEVPVQAVPQSQ